MMIIVLLLKSSAIVAIIYLFYWLCLRSTTFIRLNRIVLVLGMVAAITFPSSTIPSSLQSAVTQPVFEIGDQVFIEHGVVALSGDSVYDGDGITIWEWAALLYFCGVALAFIRLLISVRSVAKILGASRRSELYGTTFYITQKSDVAFSFFNMIIVPDGMTSHAVLRHEEGHVKNYHWFDLLVVELITIALWFNPFIYFYRNALRQVHEYQADQWAVSRGLSVPQYLQAMMADLTSTSRQGITSGFSSHSIKSRINMLTKNKTPMTRSLFYLLLLPICSLMLFAFAHRTPQVNPRTFTIVIDPAHGGSDVGATAPDGWTEKQFTLALGMKLKELGAKRGIEVVLTRENDATVSLQDRVAHARPGSTVGFISLHGGTSGDNSSATIFVNKDGGQRQRSEKLAGNVIIALGKFEALKLNSINYSSAFVLRENSTPAIIVEIGNLSTADGMRFMKEARNQERIAESLLEAIIGFVE